MATKTTTATPDTTATCMIKLKDITVDPSVHVRLFDTGDEMKAKDVEGLAASMARLGQIQEIVVTPDAKKESKYNLLVGSRRLRAAQELGWKDIRARVVPVMPLEQAKATAISENVRRRQMSPVEIAMYIQSVFDANKLNPAKTADVKLVADIVQMKPTTIYGYMPILGLSKSIQKRIHNGELSAGAAWTLEQIADLDLRAEVLARAEEIQGELDATAAIKSEAKAEALAEREGRSAPRTGPKAKSAPVKEGGGKKSGSPRVTERAVNKAVGEKRVKLEKAGEKVKSRQKTMTELIAILEGFHGSSAVVNKTTAKLIAALLKWAAGESSDDDLGNTLIEK